MGMRLHVHNVEIHDPQVHGLIPCSVQGGAVLLPSGSELGASLGNLSAARITEGVRRTLVPR